VVARLHEKPLDRSRPLWDLVVLTGLPDHQVAYYNRVHHACLDGMAAQASTQLLMDIDPLTPEAKQPLPANSGTPIGIASHLQGMFEAMLAQSIETMFNSPARSAAMNRIWQRANDPAKGIGAAFTPCPDTPINANIDRARVFAAGQIPLPELKQLAKHMHCTINDVFMAVCGGALRSYLQRRNGLPETTMIAGCPVSMRKAGDSSNNNQVSMMRIALGTHIADHVERVKYVRRSTDQAKRLLIEARPMLADNFTAPALGLAIRSAQLANGLMGTADRMPPPINVLISNVPGPRKPLYSNGARMLSHYPISIPTHGVGVNITVQSYTDTLYVGVTAASRSAPDADRLRDDIDEAFAALYNAMTAEIVELQQVKSASEAVAARPSSPEKPYVTGFNEQVA
jgi:diacylglycerol O-acyltransferase